MSAAGSKIAAIDLNTDIQAALQEYVDTHDINNLFAGLVEAVLLEQPENPVKFIVDHLVREYPDRVAAPSAVGSFGSGLSSSMRGGPAAGSGPEHDSDSKAGGSDSDSDSEDDEDDYIDELPALPYRGTRRRTSVSAESSVDPRALKMKWEADKKVYPKTDHEKRVIRSIMAENMLFKNLDADQTEIVVDAMSPVLVRAGHDIIKQGSHGDLFYVVESGAPEVYVETNGVSRHVVTYRNGDSFGELALMYNAPRAATVKAKMDCRLWALDRLTFKVILMETTMTKRRRYESFLSRVPILGTLTEYERATIADALHQEQFVAGQTVCKQGEPGNKFYIVEKGEISITQTASPGAPSVEVMRSKIGSYFGEIALMTDQPRKATATAVVPTSCLTLDRKTFSRVMGPLKELLKRNMAKYEAVMAEVEEG